MIYIYIYKFWESSTDLRKIVHHGLKTVIYTAPTIWAKFPSEYKLASSLKNSM